MLGFLLLLSFVDFEMFIPLFFFFIVIVLSHHSAPPFKFPL